MKGNGELTLQDVLDAMNAGFARVDKRFDAMGASLSGLNRRFDEMLKNVGGHFRDHERRITALEKTKKR